LIHNIQTKMAHPSVALPRDVEDNRFIQSFSLTEQEDEYKQFFEQMLLVVRLKNGQLRPKNKMKETK